eukprot:scaffold2529_cov57-Attheya_sp.AAC.1
MLEVEEASRQTESSGAPLRGESKGTMSASTTASSGKEGTQIIDLEGVTCEPFEDGSTLWHFHCDGAHYPGRLVNLPCPVEVHKTHDHTMYYKCADVGQALIVYEDENAMDEAESAAGYNQEGFPSYYHSGLTPPMKRVVERRFEAREHKSVAPPRSEVMDVENELIELIEKISTAPAKGKGKGKGKSSALSAAVSKVLDEVVEDVVDYEPWMDDHGRQPKGIEFDDKDVMCTKHPEIWLDPKEVLETTNTAAKKLEEEESAQDSSDKGKKKKSSGKKDDSQKSPKIKKDGSKKDDKKKSKKKKLEDKISSSPSQKKGIPALKARAEVDQVSQAAAQMSQMEDIEAFLLDDDNFFDFAGDDDFADIQLD